jgi:hypothetical protein
MMMNTPSNATMTLRLQMSVTLLLLPLIELYLMRFSSLHHSSWAGFRYAIVYPCCRFSFQLTYRNKIQFNFNLFTLIWHSITANDYVDDVMILYSLIVFPCSPCWVRVTFNDSLILLTTPAVAITVWILMKFKGVS